MIELKPCPFCGGRAAVSFKDAGFGGQNYNGDKRLKYRVQVICNKCHARGKPITTDWIVNATPYITRFYLEQTKARARRLPEEYRRYIKKKYNNLIMIAKIGGFVLEQRCPSCLRQNTLENGYFIPMKKQKKP